MNLITELRSNGFPALHTTPNVICRVFEDNKSCLEIAINHKSRPRTKHLSVRLHHFRSYVKAKLINIEHISTKDQITDILTKPLPRQQFRVLRDQLMGWPSYPLQLVRECETPGLTANPNFIRTCVYTA